MQGKRIVHLISNAHLDPVWLWEWQEGAATTLSTFRIAAELAESDQAFIFNHNEAVLYEWVRQMEPALFKRIQKLVKAGRWNLMGGWYIQPDCNMPSGESFTRQMLLGRNYFKKYFGVDVTTAINFDPFGHTQGLVQLLAKAGFDSYLFGRPHPDFGTGIPNHFVWVGFDGSEVLATRFPTWYNTQLGKARQTITERLAVEKDMPTSIILWGVGDHGGGPSRYDLKEVDKLIQEVNYAVDLRHSTPQAHFAALNQIRPELPRVKRDLNAWAIGCYTSMVRIKQMHRELENEIYSLEKMATAASLQGLMDYPRAELDQAIRDLLFAEFHDALPGSSIPPVEKAMIQQLGRGLQICAEQKLRAFVALAAGQKAAPAGELPLLVYNPHPHAVAQMVECEFHMPDYDKEHYRPVDIYREGKLLPSQVEHAHCGVGIDWRKRVAFPAVLAPGMNRFDCRFPRMLKAKPAPKRKARAGKIKFKTRELDVVINTRTGLVDRYKVNGVSLLQAGAFQPLAIRDNSDCWEGFAVSFRKVAGRFKLAGRKDGSEISGVLGKIDSVRVIEDGPARSIVEAVYAWNRSFVITRYHLPKQGTEMELEVRVLWNEKDTMLKLAVPTRLADGKYIGQVACGVSPDLPQNGDEAVAQKWTAVVSRAANQALTCVNEGSYGSDYAQGEFRLTLLRAPAYSAGDQRRKEDALPQDRFTPRHEQGERLFHFWFNAGKVRQRLEAIDREALAWNEKPMALNFFPPGAGRKPKAGALLSDEVVQLQALKRAEDGEDVIVRLFEPTGKPRQTVLSLPALGVRAKVDLGGFEVKTLRINPRRRTIKEVGLLEVPLKTPVRRGGNGQVSRAVHRGQSKVAAGVQTVF